MMDVSAYRFSATRWATFNAVGLVGFLVQLVSLWLLEHVLSLHYLLATAAAVELAILHNFSWHAGSTWGDRPAAGYELVKRLVRFNLTTGAISIVGNIVLTAALVEAGHMHYLVANVISVAVCSLANFVVADLLVFAPILGVALGAAATTVRAADLDLAAAQAFDRYTRLTEVRMDQERRGEVPFLWMERLPEARRRDVDARLRRAR